MPSDGPSPAPGADDETPRSVAEGGAPEPEAPGPESPDPEAPGRLPPPVPPPPPPGARPSGPRLPPPGSYAGPAEPRPHPRPSPGPVAGVPTDPRSPAPGIPPPPTGVSRPPAAPPREPPRRLHPFGVVRGVSLRNWIGALPAFLVIAAQADLAFALLLPVALAIAAAVRVLAWSRHTYELRGGRIIERSGVLSRSERALEIERIQQIDVERTLLDRAVGTCELRLETAADSGESELKLTVVTVEEAERLRGVLAEASARLASERAGTTTGGASDGRADATDDRGGAQRDAGGTSTPDADDAPAGEQLIAVPLTHVALAAVTGPRLLVVPAGIAVAVGFVFEAWQPADPDAATEAAGDVVDRAASFGFIGLAALVVVAVVVMLAGAAIVGMLRDGGFEVVRRGREIVVRRGLTTTRTATVPLRRIQRVSVGRSWVHGLLGFATLTIHTAGSVGQGGQGEAQSSLDRSLMVPLLPVGDVDRLLEALLGTSDVPALAAHPHAARRRAVVRSLLVASLPATGAAALGVATGFVVPAALAVVVLLACAVAVGLARYDKLATGIGDQLVAGRTGLIGTTTVLAPRRKVQGVSVRSTPFQRRRDLATASVHVAGPKHGLTLQDLGGRTAVAIRRTLA